MSQAKFSIPKRMGLPASEGFVRRRLRRTLEKSSSHKEITSERESFQSMRSLPAQEVAEGLEGLLNLPFLEDDTKRTRF